MNIMSVDVEPWYCDLDESKWGNYEDNVVKCTNKIIAMLEETDNKATFFILAEIAKKYPDLIREIKDRGHEIGSHGTHHIHLSELDRETLAEDVATSVHAIQAAGINEISGFRAPQFSLSPDSMFLISELIEQDFLYDSSVFPVWTPLYGIPDAPRTPYRISETTPYQDSNSQFWEFPMSTYKLPVFGRNLPIAGGFYLRSIPYRLLNYLLNSTSIAPNVCYIHPWELISANKRVDDYPWFRYHGRRTAEKKLKYLLRDFSFTTMKDYLNNHMSSG